MPFDTARAINHQNSCNKKYFNKKRWLNLTLISCLIYIYMLSISKIWFPALSINIWELCLAVAPDLPWSFSAMAFQLWGPYLSTSSLSFWSSDGLQWPLLHMLHPAKIPPNNKNKTIKPTSRQEKSIFCWDSRWLSNWKEQRMTITNRKTTQAIITYTLNWFVNWMNKLGGLGASRQGGKAKRVGNKYN